MRLVWGLDKQVGEYVAAQFPIAIERGGFKVVRAVGIADQQNRLIGGIVMTEFRGHDAELSIYCDTPNALTPKMLRELCSWAFEGQNMKRLTASVSKKNKRSRRFVQGIGFRLEGTKRYGFHDGTDECIYGMTYDNCRWLK